MPENRTALITGSTSGIGLATVKALAKSGHSIAFHGFGDPGFLAELVESTAREFNVQTRHFPGDLRVPAEIRSLVSRVEEYFGSIDVLVNNAGIQHLAAVEDLPDDKWDEILAVNLSAAFHATKAVVPGMRRRDRGRIVNIASVHGLVASVNKCAYVAAKHGIVGLTKAVALELAETNITVNAICPGWVRTPLVEKQIVARAAVAGVSVEEFAVQLVSEKHPNRKFMRAEDIAALIAFLCGDHASGMTGDVFTADGGWTAQ